MIFTATFPYLPPSKMFIFKGIRKSLSSCVRKTTFLSVDTKSHRFARQYSQSSLENPTPRPPYVSPVLAQYAPLMQINSFLFEDPRLILLALHRFLKGTQSLTECVTCSTGGFRSNHHVAVAVHWLSLFPLH